MEDPITKVLRSFWDVGIIGTNHPDVLEDLLITGVAGLNNQPAHRVHDDRSGTTVYTTR